MYTPPVRRTQIYLEDGQTRRLREIAAARGTSTAWVVRDAVNRYLAEEEGQEPDDPFRDFIGSVEGLPADAAARHDHYLYGAEQ